MKFSAVLLAAFFANTAAFSPAKTSSINVKSLFAATLEAPEVKAVAPEPTSDVAVKPAISEMAVEKDWPVDIVKDSDRVQPGRYNDKANSIAVPFLPRPTALDGSHAGDYGFDPLGLSEKLDFYSMQESEIRHARLAMLAVVGWPMSELLAPSWMLQNGCAPSVLNGFNPLSFLATAAAFGALGYFEFKTSLRSNEDTAMGKLHKDDMSAIWKYGVAGDYNWDPLNLYSSCGNDYKGRKGLRDVEVSHGRWAMVGISYFALWEYLTGHPIVENSMFFHPNAVLPLLVASYAAWSQIYEIGPLNEYPIEIKYTNEGEMKLMRLKKGLQETVDAASKSAEKSKAQFDVLDEKFGIVEKLSAAPKEIEEKIRSTYKYW